MKNKEFKVYLAAEKVRDLCDRYDFCDRMEQAEYDFILDLCGQVEPDTLEIIAERIWEGTSDDNEYLREYEPLDEVLCLLVSQCSVQLWFGEVIPANTKIRGVSSVPRK